MWGFDSSHPSHFRQRITYVAPSSSGLGRRPLKAEVAGSNPVGATRNHKSPARGIFDFWHPWPDENRRFDSCGTLVGPRKPRGSRLRPPAGAERIVGTDKNSRSLDASEPASELPEITNPPPGGFVISGTPGRMRTGGSICAVRLHHHFPDVRSMTMSFADDLSLHMARAGRKPRRRQAAQAQP